MSRNCDASWIAGVVTLGALLVNAAALGQTAADLCADAPAIAAGPMLYAWSNTGAGTDGSSACGGSADVWYRFDAPADGMLLVSSCGSTLDTVLSLHGGCPGDIGNQIACSNDETLFGPCAMPGSRTSFLCARVSGGQPYRIRIAGAGGATGAFQLRLTFAPGRGITILNHGFQLSDSPTTNAPNWLFTMAWAIQKRVPCSRIGYYEPLLQQFLVGSFTSGGTWQPTATPLTLDESLETILIFDWAVESGGLFKNDYRYEGWAESAGDALFAALTRQVGDVPSLHGFRWHFIGHSRGAVVNSETVERLAGYGVVVDQMTMLDPHDWDQSGVPYDEDWKDWMLGQPQAPDHSWPMSWGFTTWSNVVYADNFYSLESTGFVPDGRQSGSLARELDVGAFTTATIDHSRVHAWYHGTADLAATSDGDGLAISSTWYPGGSRAVEGWNHAALGGVARPGPTNTLLTYAPVWEPLADGVFNGDFRYRSPFKPDPIAGWYLHGGDQVEDTIRTEPGGNTYLELNSANPVATHNLLVVPPTATHLRFRVLQNVARDGGMPEVFIGGEVYGQWISGRVCERGAAWSTVEYGIEPMDRGKPVIVSVMMGTGSTTVGIDDLEFVVIVPPCSCPGDADGSLQVDFADITAVLGSWGAAYPSAGGTGDADCDGVVNFQDLTMILSRWGAACQ